MPIWGRLANSGFTDRRIKATLFFAGQACDGTNKYNCRPAPNPNLSLYTMNPVDDVLLRWTESTVNQDVALDQMVKAGINVIHMSSWGEDFLRCAWVSGAAPMQTSPEAHNELFAAAVAKPVLIVPFIESRFGGLAWTFRGEFPRTPDGVQRPELSARS